MSDVQIFQLLGIAYLAVGIGVLINPDFYKKMLGNFAENPAVIYISAFIVLAIGYLLVAFHNIWVKDWVVIITVIGWIALIKGLTMLIFPKIYINISKALKEKMECLVAEAIFIVTLGIFLIYLGFFR